MKTYTQLREDIDLIGVAGGFDVTEHWYAPMNEDQEGIGIVA